MRQIIYLLIFGFLVPFGAMGQSDFTVKFKTGDFTPDENITSYSQSSIRNSEIINGKVYRFIQFQNIPSAGELENIRNRGVDILSFIPHNTYLVAIPTNLTQDDLVKMKSRSIWELDSNQKLHHDVFHQSLPEYAIENGQAKLIVQFYENLEYQYVEQELLKKGIDVVNYNGMNNFVYITLPVEDTHMLKDLPFVNYVSPVSPPAEKEDLRGRSLHRVNQVNNNNLGIRNYTGEGITMVCRDDGAIFNHTDFHGRLNQDFVGPDRGNHGDGVAGIMAGSGNIEPDNQGMAYGSTLYTTDYNSGFQENTLFLFGVHDAIITNSSYSNGCNSGYTATTRVVDQQLFDNPSLIHVFSAGNSGTGTVNQNNEPVDCGYGAGLTWGNITGGHKIGKNAIATANVDYRGIIETSSSRGPSADGRIKPDIAANGHNHVSTDDDFQYRNFSGTSGASPVVAGVLGVMHEAYELNYGERARSALLKAMILNTGNDFGNKGPDFIFGWGLLNAYRAILLLEENRFSIESIQQGVTQEHTIPVPEGVAELRVMVYWPDPEGSEFSSVTLNNNIDSRITDQNGDEHLPWFLDPTPDASILSSPATKTGNEFLNNMEQIAIDFPESGEFVLSVDGAQIPDGVAEYYVLWEYRMDGIDVTYPDGGENVEARSNEVIRWDAEGNVEDERFDITLITSDGEERNLGSAPGNVRFFEWTTPNTFDEGATIRITRGDQVSESQAPFMLAERPEGLDVDFENDEAILNWDAVPDAVSYNIHTLGEKFMDNRMTVTSDTFVLPAEGGFQENWVAVSANFPDGTEGKRSRAIATVTPPVALGTNNVDNQPCVNQPITYETQTFENDLNVYNWQFGSNALPTTADTRGPHTVVYTTRGNALAALFVTNPGGEDDVFFVLNIGDRPTMGDIQVSDQGSGTFSFNTSILTGDTYTWDFGDGTTAEGKNVEHTYDSSGEYEVTILAENRCGIRGTSENVQVVIASVEEATESGFVISPNPSNGDFSIELPELGAGSLSIKMISTDGKLVDQRVISNPSKGQKVRWSNINSGIYVVQMTDGENEWSTRIVVQ